MQLRDFQRFLADKDYYRYRIDGIDGKYTRRAVEQLLLKVVGDDIHRWSESRRDIAVEQFLYKENGIDVGPIDGLVGEQTRYARRVYNARRSYDEASETNWRDDESVGLLDLPGPFSFAWPTESGCVSYFGDPGENQTLLTLPFTMRLAWDLSTEVTRVSCHTKCAEAFETIWQQVLDHYGMDGIRDLRLDHFGGCLNVRRKRGGRSWSMHAYGIAWDVDPERNQLRWGADRAQLDDSEYEAFWNIVQSVGGVSLGKTKNYDWMHFQFARLG